MSEDKPGRAFVGAAVSIVQKRSKVIDQQRQLEQVAYFISFLQACCDCQ